MTAWLTRVVLNPRHPAVRRDLTDAAGMHQRVMSMLPDDLGDQPRREAGVLYRLDTTVDATLLLVQTTLRTDLTKLPDGYGATATRDITALLAALSDEMPVHYRIAANPSKRAASGRDKGSLVALSGVAAESWWHHKAEQHGLALQTLTAVAQPAARTKESKMRHAVTRFDGRAIITNVDQTRQAVLGGIGRGRAYGCGLLSLAPVR